MTNEKVDSKTLYNETSTTTIIATMDEKRKEENQQPDRYLTPQPAKPIGIKTLQGKFQLNNNNNHYN